MDFKAVRKLLDKRFDDLPEYYTPMFPVLTSLDICHLARHRDLEIFANSPISSLVICCLPRSFSEYLTLSIFHRLRSLSVRYMSAADNYTTTTINKVFLTVCPSLQHLTLAMNLRNYFQLQFSAPSFADSLTLLTLEDEYRQDDVEYMLQLFPNLHTFSVCAIFSEPLFRYPNSLQSITG